MGKGQVSFFVIIGLVILIISGFIYIKFNQDKIDAIRNQMNPDDPKTKPVKKHIEQCLLETGVAAMKKLGDQGLIYPDAYISTKNADVAYFYFKGKGYFPQSIALVEKDVSGYVMENIIPCLDKFARAGVTLEKDVSKMAAYTEFRDREMNLTIILPVKASIGGEEYDLEKFSVKIETGYKSMYSLSEKIYASTKDSPEWINLEFAKDYDYDIKLIKIDKITLIYEITDNTYGLENKPFRYRFAVKYGL